MMKVRMYMAEVLVKRLVREMQIFIHSTSSTKRHCIYFPLMLGSATKSFFQKQPFKSAAKVRVNVLYSEVLQ